LLEYLGATRAQLKKEEPELARQVLDQESRLRLIERFKKASTEYRRVASQVTDGRQIVSSTRSKIPTLLVDGESFAGLRVTP